MLKKLILAGALASTIVATTINAMADKQYYQGAYPDDHWARQPFTPDDQRLIATASFNDHNYAIYINLTDKRGYRCLIRLIDNENMASTFNREYTTEEVLGLNLLTHVMTKIYSEIAPIAQSAVAGNNSHSFNKETGITLIGKPEEPSLLHAHIWARGNPESCYISDVKLDGPQPGLNFDMMAKTLNEPGNNAKVKWQNNDMKKVINYLKAKLDDVKTQYNSLGITIHT